MPCADARKTYPLSRREALQIGVGMFGLSLPPYLRAANAAAATDGNVPAPGGGILARSLNEMYRPPGASPTTVAMRAGSITNEGGGQGHENMQPFLILNYVIALQGLFPSEN